MVDMCVYYLGKTTLQVAHKKRQMPKQKAQRAFEPMWVTMPSKQRGKHTFIEVPNKFAFYVMWMIFAQPPRRGVSRADIDAAVFVRSKKMLLSKQPTAYDKELATIRYTNDTGRPTRTQRLVVLACAPAALLP
jgi:hypothetical protein